MAASKNAKDVILVNCQEVPESICVETRFITQSGKQKKIDKIFFTTTNSNYDLNKDDPTATIVSTAPKAPSFNVGIKPNPVSIGHSPIPSPVAQCQLLQQTQSASSIAPITGSLSNPSKSNVFSNLPAGQDLLRSAIATQLGNSSQVPPFTLSTSILSSKQLGTLNTPNIHSFIEQVQQTDVSAFNTKSVAIQCKLDDELEDLDEWETSCEQSNEFTENLETDKENFVEFLKNNSTKHKNFKECLICGELCRSNKYLYCHMAVHRGPKALCFKCGQYLEHDKLLQQHKCQKARQLSEAFLKCPHFSCNVNAISLQELYDHINEHTNSRLYKCSACGKGFCTGQEFSRHILIRPKCNTSAKRKFFRMYGLKSEKDRKCRVRVFTLQTYKKSTTLVKTFLSQRADKKGLCKICFKILNNKSAFNRHRIICMDRFKKRIIRKRNIN